MLGSYFFLQATINFRRYWRLYGILITFITLALMPVWARAFVWSGANLPTKPTERDLKVISQKGLEWDKTRKLMTGFGRTWVWQQQLFITANQNLYLLYRANNQQKMSPQLLFAKGQAGLSSNSIDLAGANIQIYFLPDNNNPNQIDQLQITAPVVGPYIGTGLKRDGKDQIQLPKELPNYQELLENWQTRINNFTTTEPLANVTLLQTSDINKKKFAWLKNKNLELYAVEILLSRQHTLGDKKSINYIETDNANFRQIQASGQVLLQQPKFIASGRNFLWWLDDELGWFYGNIIVRTKKNIIYLNRLAEYDKKKDFIMALNGVKVVTARETISGKRGYYYPAREQAFVCGNVSIIRTNEQLFGECADVNLVSGKSVIQNQNIENFIRRDWRGITAPTESQARPKLKYQNPLPELLKSTRILATIKNQEDKTSKKLTTPVKNQFDKMQLSVPVDKTPKNQMVAPTTNSNQPPKADKNLGNETISPSNKPNRVRAIIDLN